MARRGDKRGHGGRGRFGITTPAQHPDESWHLFCADSVLAMLNARLSLVVDGADRPHYDALADQYADAALFAPSREATRSPAAARDDDHPADE